MPAAKPKNRRARNAKISEYRLRKLVLAFAQDLTVRETAMKTGLSEPTVRQHFMTLRQRLHDHGFLRVNRRSGGPMPARIIFAKKHRGVPERYAHLYEAEFLNRVFATKNIRRVWKFAASDPKDMEKLKKFVAYNKLNDKYDIIEALAGKPQGDENASRAFDPYDYETTSTIIVNERNIDPHEAFFRHVWSLILKFPL